MDMLLPLYRQFDSGFGAVANSFKASADALEKTPEAGGLHPHLPISFLYRHSIELYLKSCIIILHKSLDIPYADTSSGEAAIVVKNKCELLTNIHALIPLYLHLKHLIKTNLDFLCQLKDADWELSADLDKRVRKIDGTDPSSTFFRYPVTKDKPKDESKSTMQPKDWSSMVEDMHSGSKSVKAFVLIDKEYNVIESFNHDAEKANAFIKLLSKTAMDFCGLQMMIVWKLVERR